MSDTAAFPQLLGVKGKPSFAGPHKRQLLVSQLASQHMLHIVCYITNGTYSVQVLHEEP